MYVLVLSWKGLVAISTPGLLGETADSQAGSEKMQDGKQESAGDVSKGHRCQLQGAP